MLDICFSYVSTLGPSKPSTGSARWNKWRISDVWRFLAREAGGRLTSKPFPKTQIVQWNPHISLSVWIGGKQRQLKRGKLAHVVQLGLHLSLAVKWGSTCSSASVTIEWLQAWFPKPTSGRYFHQCRMELNFKIPNCIKRFPCLLWL